MPFTKTVVDINLDEAQLAGLSRPRRALWDASIAAASTAIKRRRLSAENTRTCLDTLTAIHHGRDIPANPNDANEQPPRKRKRANSAHIAPRHKHLSEHYTSALLSDVVNEQLSFLPGHTPHTWTSAAVQRAANVMSGVFRQLLLCESAWMRRLPVAVVAAAVEALATYPAARKPGWWWGRLACRTVMARSIEICGRVCEARVVERVRASLQLLVTVVRYASLLSEGCRLDSRFYPLGRPRRAASVRQRSGKLYMTVDEVLKIVALLERLEWWKAGEALREKLDFQCSVARSNVDNDAECAEHCYYCEDEERTIVTCGTGVVVELSQIVGTIAKVALALRENDAFLDLVKKTSSDESNFAPPFLLAQLLTEGAMSIVPGAAVSRVCGAIEERITDTGDVIAARNDLKPRDVRASLRTKRATETTSEPRSELGSERGV